MHRNRSDARCVLRMSIWSAPAWRPPANANNKFSSSASRLTAFVSPVCFVMRFCISTCWPTSKFVRNRTVQAQPRIFSSFRDDGWEALVLR